MRADGVHHQQNPIAWSLHKIRKGFGLSDDLSLLMDTQGKGPEATKPQPIRQGLFCLLSQAAIPLSNAKGQNGRSCQGGQ